MKNRRNITAAEATAAMRALPDLEQEPCAFCGVTTWKGVPMTVCDECREYRKALAGCWLVNQHTEGKP